MDSKVSFEAFDFRAGDHVILVDDDWNLVGTDIIVVDAKPVPSSTQCIISVDGEKHVVSRGALRPA